MTRGLRLVTHGGTFHCDEVLGYAILKRALPPDDWRASSFVRTRDPEVIAEADIVWDVGAEYDPSRGRFDHHMCGAPVRSDGTPYSSAGLLWVAYGRAAVRAMLAGRADDSLVERVWQDVDEQVVRLVDLADNGRRLTPAYGVEELDRAARVADGMTIPFIVDDLNPPWDVEPANRTPLENERFQEAVTQVGAFLDNRVEQIRARIAAYDAVIDAHARSADPRVLELDWAMPWQGPAHEADLPVLFAVYPDKDGAAWMVACMPPEPGSFAQKLTLPTEWAGLRDANLAAASGVPDAVFCHLNRFVCGARSKKGALDMVRRALELEFSPQLQA